jgi:hypothetical protein
MLKTPPVNTGQKKHDTRRALIISAGAALAHSMPVKAQEPNAYPITCFKPGESA